VLDLLPVAASWIAVVATVAQNCLDEMARDGVDHARWLGASDDEISEVVARMLADDRVPLRR